MIQELQDFATILKKSHAQKKKQPTKKKPTNLSLGRMSLIKENNEGFISGKCMGKEGRQMGGVMLSITKNNREGSVLLFVFYF